MHLLQLLIHLKQKNMKKNYSLLSSTLLFTVMAFAQNEQTQKGLGKPVRQQEQLDISYSSSALRAVSYDTTGILNVSDFQPEFASVSSNYYWWTFGTNGGYCFGNNKNFWNIWAQGYANLNNKPVKVIGIIAGFRKKEHDNPSASANSAVTFYLFSMASNSACNTNGSGTYNNTTLNFAGPSGAPVATASLLFSAIDTAVNATKGNGFPRSNYIPFTTHPTFTGDFAIAIDTRATTTAGAGYLSAGTLAPGDTVALCTDINGDAKNLDYAYTLQGYSGTSPTWIVADQWNSNPAAPDYGTGAMDVDIALFAVFSDATGIDEFYNGMKLSTYPNPCIERATIEYTLEKNATKVTLNIFDEHGGKIIENEYGSQVSGTYKVDVDTKDIAAGTYFYQLRADGRNFTKQFIVTK